MSTEDRYKVCPHRNILATRQRVSPTGPNKYDIYILIIKSSWCSCQYPVFPERLTWHEKRWIERWNKKATEDIKET